MGASAILSSLVALIPKTVYLLTMSLLGVIDVFQLLFRKLAGLDVYYVGGEAQTGDVIYDFLRGILFGDYPILSNVFFGLLILGFILLFLSTIVAIIRNEYTTEKAENSKSKIIGKAFKSILYFAIVPIVVLFGVYLANVVLMAVDKATTYNTNYAGTLDKSKLQAVEVAMPFGEAGTAQYTFVTYNIFGLKDASGLPYGTTTTTFSGTIFKAAAYGANRVRTTADMSTNPEDGAVRNFGYLLKTGAVTNFDGLFSDPNGNTENIATKIDIAFADNVVLKKPAVLDFTSQYAKEVNDYSITIFPSQVGVDQQVMDKFNVNLVWYYYDLWSFNFIIALGAAIIMVTIFINIIFGLMRRIVEMIGLFLMAPPLIALMPLDGERAYKDWQKSFVKKALMAYGAVGGMNIIFLILPELQTISFFNNTMLDWFVDTLLVLVALLAVKDFIGVVSGFAGGDDANKVGGDIGKDVAGMAAKGLLMGMSTIGLAAGGIGLAGRTVMAAKDMGVAAKRAWQARGVRGDSTNVKHTAIARDHLKDQHKEESKAEAQAKVYEKYRALKIGDLDKDLTDATSANYDAGLAALKTTDGAAYQRVLEERLRNQYAEDRKSGTLINDSGIMQSIKAMENVRAKKIFNDKQAEVNVTNQDVYEMTEHGKYRKARKELKEQQAEAETKQVKREIGREVRGLKGKYYGGIATDITKPTFGAINNAVTTNLSIFADNNFAKEFGGKGGENIKDMMYRVTGRTLAEVNKAKEKAANAEKEAKALRNQADAIAEAIKRNK